MKQAKDKAARSDITVLPIIPGTVVLSCVLLLSFLVLLVVLNVSGMISLPHWIEQIIGTAPDEGGPEDRFSQEFLAALSGEEQMPQTDLLYMETDPDALLSLLMQGQSVSDYYQTCTVTRTSSGSAAVTRQISRIVSGEREFAEIVTRGGLIRSVTTDANTVCITEGSASRRFSRTEDSVFTAESELGIPSFARMQKMLAEAAEGKYTLAMSTSQNTVCIRVEFTDTASGTREIYEVLPDCGLVFAAQSYLPGADTPHYVMTTDSLLTDISGFDESVFDMPNP